MITTELIRYALANLLRRQRRSWLTVISVMIGIAAVTTLISFGTGISSYVESISQNMGKDKLIIQPRGFGFGPSLGSNVHLDNEDVDTVERVTGVAEATGMYVEGAEVESNKQKKFVFLAGADMKEHRKLIDEVYSLKLVEGNELKGNEKTKAIFGYNYKVQDKIFKRPLTLRNTVLINGKEIKVAGFYDKVGNPQDDSNVYITSDAAEEVFNAKSYFYILARSNPGVAPTQLTESIKKELRHHRNQKEGAEDFFVQTFEQVIATFNAILSVITGVVVLIGLISIIVAAVNIMNTMYAAILERTKEIGIFKAIGSKNIYILTVFVFESGTLSLVGGILGIILGYALATAAGSAIAQAGYSAFSPKFTWQLAAGSLAFSAIVGILSGLLPAYRASKLEPIEALRYE